MLYILPLEWLKERYTIQWYNWFLDATSRLDIPVRFIQGESLGSSIKSGRVLDINGTCYWKATQLAEVAKLFDEGLVKDGDKFFAFDLWYPGIESIRYMADLQHIKVELSGFLHAGSYLDADFSASLALWARHFERAWYHLVDKIFVGSKYHRSEFFRKRLQWFEGKIVVTGNPFNSVEVSRFKIDGTRDPAHRKNVIVFSNRWDTDKRPDLFINYMNLLWKQRQDFEVWATTSRPEFRSNDPALLNLLHDQPFPFTAFADLSKDEYYQLLCNAKVFVSTAELETFGYCAVEAMAAGCTPVLPDGMSYPELVGPEFLYRTPEEAVSRISNFLDSPIDCSNLASRFDNVVDLILNEILHT